MVLASDQVTALYIAYPYPSNMLFHIIWQHKNYGFNVGGWGFLEFLGLLTFALLC